MRSDHYVTLMYKPLSLFIGLRYLRAKHRNRFASFISITSTLGIALGVAVLIIVLSVMNGFEREVAAHVVGMTSHATAYKLGEPMRDWQRIASVIREMPHVLGVEPFIRGSGMLNRRGKVRGIVLYGIPPTAESNVTDLPRYLGPTGLAELVDDGTTPRVIIGISLAEALGATTGDTLSLIIPQWDPRDGIRAPLFRQMQVAGIFRVGMHEFDSNFALVDIQQAANLFHLEGAVSGLRIRFDDATQAKALGEVVSANLGSQFLVLDWAEFHRNFFQALKSQKRILFVILSLIIAVAAFNIVASMMMVVKEKTSDIAILRTLGCSPHQVLIVFITQGAMIGLIGVLLGIGGGALGAHYANDLLRWVEKLFGVQLIKPDVYYISYLPTQIQTPDVVVVSLLAFLICVLATVYPAWRASKIAPVDALRYD
jgi:lipoprotein-releasing system permease protein